MRAFHWLARTYCVYVAESLKQCRTERILAVPAVLSPLHELTAYKISLPGSLKNCQNSVYSHRHLYILISQGRRDLGLVILTYQASFVQNLDIMYPVIKKKSNKSIAFIAIFVTK